MSHEEAIGHLRGLILGLAAGAIGAVVVVLATFVYFVARFGWNAASTSPSPPEAAFFDPLCFGVTVAFLIHGCASLVLANLMTRDDKESP